MTAIERSSPHSEGALAPLVRLVDGVNGLLSRIPHWLIASLARFSIAAVFWKSGQTKVEGLAIDLVQGQFQIGLPHFSSSAIDLFRDEYRLPVLPPELAAFMAASAEHVFSALILVGFATRLSATALFMMTLVIEIFVYPDAYPTHGVWAVCLLYLMSRGPGPLSLDHLVKKRFG
ncbi:MAG: DoxX family protein [Beijerinckiaceae bacterium]